MSAEYRVSRGEASAESAAVTGRLIGLLPAWFGMAESNAEYIGSAKELPGFVAKVGAPRPPERRCRSHRDNTCTDDARLPTMSEVVGWLSHCGVTSSNEDSGETRSWRAG